MPFPKWHSQDVFGAEAENHFIDDWEDGALASCCGVNLAGLIGGRVAFAFPKTAQGDAFSAGPENHFIDNC
jgi:hypothetical protein